MRARAVIARALLFCFAASSSASADTVIGVAAPFSGRNHGMGEDVRRGAEAAVARLNAAGGVLGAKLSLIFEDDGCEQAKAAAAAQSLAARAPAIIIGNPCSGAAVAAASVYKTAGALFISTGARHESLTLRPAGAAPQASEVASRSGSPALNESPMIFRLAGRDDRQGEAAAAWLNEVSPGRRIVLVHDGSKYSRAIVDGAERHLRSLGMANIPDFVIRTGREDYGDVVGRVAALSPEAVFFAGYPIEAAIVLKAMRQSLPAVWFLGPDALASEAFGKAAQTHPDRVRVLLPNELGPVADWCPAEIPGYSRYSRSSRALMARTFAAIEAWADAAAASGSVAPGAVAAALVSRDLETSAAGAVAFDENGDARVPSFVPAFWTGDAWVSGDGDAP